MSYTFLHYLRVCLLRICLCLFKLLDSSIPVMGKCFLKTISINKMKYRFVLHKLYFNFLRVFWVFGGFFWIFSKLRNSQSRCKFWKDIQRPLNQKGGYWPAFHYHLWICFHSELTSSGQFYQHQKINIILIISVHRENDVSNFLKIKEWKYEQN